jgi:hypothetical protein
MNGREVGCDGDAKGIAALIGWADAGGSPGGAAALEAPTRGYVGAAMLRST